MSKKSTCVCTGCADLLTQAEYNQIKKTVAKEFARYLQGQGGFTDPGINRIALEGMIVGYLRSTPQWAKQHEHIAQCHKNSLGHDEYMIAWDQALQIADDLVGHAEPESVKLTRLQQDVEKAKKVLGFIPRN